MPEEKRARVLTRQQIRQALKNRAGREVAAEFEELLNQGRKVAALKLARTHGIHPVR